MKRLGILGCFFMTIASAPTLFAAQNCTTPTANECACTQMISLLDMCEDTTLEFSKGKLCDTVIVCPEGALIPLRLNLKGSLIALQGDCTPLHIKLLKTCYVRCETENQFLFSSDLQHWKSPSEFFHGELNISVKNGKEGPVAGIELELNQEKESCCFEKSICY